MHTHVHVQISAEMCNAVAAPQHIQQQDKHIPNQDIQYISNTVYTCTCSCCCNLTI
jgi:hypothetical protein